MGECKVRSCGSYLCVRGGKPGLGSSAWTTQLISQTWQAASKAMMSKKVAAGIAIAAVADVTVLDMTLRSKACPVNAGTATAKYKGRCGFPLSFENAA